LHTLSRQWEVDAGFQRVLACMPGNPKPMLGDEIFFLAL